MKRVKRIQRQGKVKDVSQHALATMPALESVDTKIALVQALIPRYAPEYNGVVERFFRTLKQECVWLHHFESFAEAESIIMAWIDHYNSERQHSALGYLTPRAWREQFHQLPKAA